MHVLYKKIKKCQHMVGMYVYEFIYVTRLICVCVCVRACVCVCYIVLFSSYQEMVVSALTHESGLLSTLNGLVFPCYVHVW